MICSAVSEMLDQEPNPNGSGYAGGGITFLQVAPAMEAGITDHIWTPARTDLADCPGGRRPPRFLCPVRTSEGVVMFTCGRLHMDFSYRG
jgi:hypothetical protein